MSNLPTATPDAYSPGVAILAALALMLQEGTPPAPSPEVQPDWLEFLHGSLRTVHRSRWTGGASDADLFIFLSLRAGNSEKDLFSGAASGRFQSDLDGDRGADGFSPFDSLSDSYRRATTSQVLTAYIDVTNAWPGVRARAGRQILDEMPEAVPMDGALASLEASAEVRIATFGGRPVNFFESSPSGDSMYGGWIEAKPWPRGRARIEYLHLKDENTFGLFKDDLIGLVLEQGDGPWLFSGRATILESEARDILLRGSAGFSESGFTLDLRAYYLFEQQQALSYGLDAFAIFLLPVEPYYQFSLNASQELSDRFGVDLAVVTRQLENADDEGDYNHEFSRWSFTVRSRKWPAEDLSVSVTGDFWQTRNDDFWTAGGAIQWQVAESVRADLSSSYTLYTIDALTGEEHERVRLVSLGIRWKVNPDVSADAKFTAEENDVDGFRTLDVGVRYAF